MKKCLKRLEILILVFVIVWGCNYKIDSIKKKDDDPLLGMKVDFMLHSVIASDAIKNSNPNTPKRKKNWKNLQTV